MKRYVKELARDVMRADHPLVKRGIVRHPGADKIEQVVKHCERGTVNIVDFGEKVQVPEIKRGAWGYADYERKLEPHEVFRYELVGGNAVDNIIPQ